MRRNSVFRESSLWKGDRVLTIEGDLAFQEETGDGDKAELEFVEKTIYEQVKEILESIKNEDFSFEKRMKIK